MTENADVEWLRATFGGYLPPEFNAFATREVDFMQMRRLLAHIDQLERYIEVFKGEALRRELCNEPEHDRRPTVHEIAVQTMAAMRLASYLSHKQVPADSETIASWSYADAEALVAEGRRRDGNA